MILSIIHQSFFTVANLVLQLSYALLQEVPFCNARLGYPLTVYLQQCISLCVGHCGRKYRVGVPEANLNETCVLDVKFGLCDRRHHDCLLQSDYIWGESLCLNELRASLCR